MVVLWLFLAMPQVCLQFVIVVFLDHTHYFFILMNVSACKQIRQFSGPAIRFGQLGAGILK